VDVSESYVGMAEASRLVGGTSRSLSDLAYQGKLDMTRWARVSGRLLVPRSELPALREALAARQRLTYPKRGRKG